MMDFYKNDSYKSVFESIEKYPKMTLLHMLLPAFWFFLFALPLSCIGYSQLHFSISAAFIIVILIMFFMAKTKKDEEYINLFTLELFQMGLIVAVVLTTAIGLAIKYNNFLLVIVVLLIAFCLRFFRIKSLIKKVENDTYKIKKTTMADRGIAGLTSLFGARMGMDFVSPGEKGYYTMSEALAFFIPILVVGGIIFSVICIFFVYKPELAFILKKKLEMDEKNSEEK
jgi:hypothetical protein